jgi:hypothetical protein
VQETNDTIDYDQHRFQRQLRVQNAIRQRRCIPFAMLGSLKYADGFDDHDLLLPARLHLSSASPEQRRQQVKRRRETTDRRRALPANARFACDSTQSILFAPDHPRRFDRSLSPQRAGRTPAIRGSARYTSASDDDAGRRIGRRDDRSPLRSYEKNLCEGLESLDSALGKNTRQLGIAQNRKIASRESTCFTARAEPSEGR